MDSLRLLTFLVNNFFIIHSQFVGTNRLFLLVLFNFCYFEQERSRTFQPFVFLRSVRFSLRNQRTTFHPAHLSGYDTAARCRGQTATGGRVSKGGSFPPGRGVSGRRQDKKRVLVGNVSFRPPRQGGRSGCRCGTGAGILWCTCSAGQTGARRHRGRHRPSSSRSR